MRIRNLALTATLVITSMLTTTPAKAQNQTNEDLLRQTKLRAEEVLLLFTASRDVGLTTSADYEYMKLASEGLKQAIRDCRNLSQLTRDCLVTTQQLNRAYEMYVEAATNRAFKVYGK